MVASLRPLMAASLLLSAALFGFFDAWVCSTVWGLDAADPRLAIGAMQAMNASVRNAVFAIAFFGTAPVLLLTALVAWRAGAPRVALATLMAGGLVVGAVIVTASVNVPLNEALGAVNVPSDIPTAQEIWRAYSDPWQRYNMLRTGLCGVAVLCVGYALTRLPR